MIGYLDSGFSIEIPEGGKLTHWRALQCETNNGARGNNNMFNVNIGLLRQFTVHWSFMSKNDKYWIIFFLGS